MSKQLVALVGLMFLAACGGPMSPGALGSSDQAVLGDNGLKGAPEHLQYAKGHGGGGGTGSALLTYHGGQVIQASKTEAIFWGTEWGTASFAADKITGLDAFFSGFGGSRYAAASTEYDGTLSSGGSGTGYVTTSSSYLGHVFDTSAAPAKALTTTSAVAEACKVIGNNPDPSALYLIYTSTGAGQVSYCAWHSWGTCSNGAPIQVAYMPNIDGLAGCDPQDTSGLHSEGLAALANVTAHELSETLTDPRGAGWLDGSGAENGDKCAWSFLAPVTLSNGSTWKLQGEWSNAAYNAGTGYANTNGQKGCLQGN